MTNSSVQYPVFLDRCPDYATLQKGCKLDSLLADFQALKNLHSSRVLLKPNLVSSSAPLHGCTDVRFIRTVAAYLKDLGAQVVLGDSPAFRSAYSVCRSKGIVDSMKELDVDIIEFKDFVPVKLDCGIQVSLARPPLECDLLVNLPKIKAHGQMYMTLAVKNCFGLVTGIQKAMLHMRYGTGYQIFSEMITDIQKILPRQIIVGDGIDAMHVTGPINGERLNLQLLAAAENPFAFDAAIFKILRLPVDKSPLMQEALRKEIKAADQTNLTYPFLGPEDFLEIDFIAPDNLIPIRFNPFRFVKSIFRRLLSIQD